MLKKITKLKTTFLFFYRLDRNWDRSGPTFNHLTNSSLFPQPVNNSSVDAFGRLITSASSSASLTNYQTPISSTSDYSHHLTSSLGETHWGTMKSTSTGGSAAVNGSDLGWTASSTFNGNFEGYNSFTTSEMLIGHHHHQYGDGKAVASFPYGHHNSSVGVSQAAAAAAAYRNYNLAKGTTAASTASFGFY
jgi:hypothetical protein